MESNDNWVFFLKLSKQLPRQYFNLDREFKKAGLTLVPITLSDLLQILKGEDRPQVICFVQNIYHFRFMYKRGQKVLTMLTRNDKIDLYILSSFSCLNQTAELKGRSNYFYLTLPVPLRKCCAIIASTIINKWRFGHTWVGGKSGKRPKILNENIA